MQQIQSVCAKQPKPQPINLYCLCWDCKLIVKRLNLCLCLQKRKLGVSFTITPQYVMQYTCHAFFFSCITNILKNVVQHAHVNDNLCSSLLHIHTTKFSWASLTGASCYSRLSQHLCSKPQVAWIEWMRSREKWSNLYWIYKLWAEVDENLSSSSQTMVELIPWCGVRPSVHTAHELLLLITF